MTAVAYRDGVISADTMTTHNYVKAHEPKVIKKEGHLFGVAGEACPSNEDLVSWFLKNKVRESLPEFKNHSFTMMVIYPEGNIKLIDNTGRFYPIKDKFWAIGSGAEVCFGAMEMGASAQEAVKAAIKWQKDCGGKVITRKL